MRKWGVTLSVLAIAAGGLLLVPRGGHAPESEALSAEKELRIKQATMNQDLALTNELCRSQCSYELHRIATDIVKDGAKPTKLLAELQQQHPHMSWLVHTSAGVPLAQGTAVGQLPERIREKAQDMLMQAKQSVDRGQSYQSGTLEDNGQQFFVLAEPAVDGRSGIVGVVEQHILSEVAEHERKNLRIVTYPAEGRYKIESVDSKTLRDVHVDHPEENEGVSHYHQNQVVVKFRSDPTEQELERIRSEIGGGTVRKLGYTYVFESQSMEAKELMSYFQKWNVAYAEPHFLYLTNTSAPARRGAATERPIGEASGFVPNDALYQRYQWNLPKVDIESGWHISKGSDQVTVAVIDTGVDLNHPDLQNQLVSGLNVVNQRQTPQDDVGHGTHVAGVIGALVNNNLGVAGMSWYNHIMPIKALDATGAGSTYAVAQGIIWAVDHGAKVINMSLGNYADAEFLHDAIRYAYDRDVVLIAASGNDNTERPGFPAAYPEVFAVAATDPNNSRATFSNYGTYIDVAAPGVSIASTYPHSQYAALSGTSMATPHVAALAALIRSVNPNLKNTEVMQLMRDTAVDLGPVGRDKYYGFGLIDVGRALQAANPNTASQRDQSSPDETIDSTWTDWLRRLLGV
ncbi:S8 family peptidase [Paenibacillus sp. YYML68]|uniref:S8 family peptidase n=1 Tax=Paenibacillus sp. YYML68 TaxID=2909250 RepID=UPI002491544E|nr:S8 family peptidase [Paenibacillus sp. YYML68]